MVAWSLESILFSNSAYTFDDKQLQRSIRTCQDVKHMCLPVRKIRDSCFFVFHCKGSLSLLVERFLLFNLFGLSFLRDV
ncbi:hypothetical protein CsSME_00035917 [Camellia sinensis var. sinensis]